MVRYAIATGNWSNVAIWDGSTTLPSAGDDVYANGFTVTIDQNITVTKISTEVCPTTSVGGGGFQVGTNKTIVANIYAGATYCLYLTVGGLTINIIGNIYGGSASGAFGVGMGATSYSNFYITGNIYGGSAVNAYGLSGYYSITAVIVGNIIGGTVASGINFSYGGTISITGNVVAQNGIGIMVGYHVLVAGLIAVIGNVTSSPTTVAIYSNDKLKINGNIINTAGRMAVNSPIMYIENTSGLVWQFQTSGLVDNFLYTVDAFDQPAEANVRSGIFYGTIYTGTCAVPPAASVVKDVPVDNTVGTWQFDEPLVNRLKNCATTAMVGQIVASYNAAPVEIIPNAEKRHDYTGTTSFCGTAVQGTLESSPTWNLTKIIVSENGTSTTTVAVNSWENRYIASYS